MSTAPVKSKPATKKVAAKVARKVARKVATPKVEKPVKPLKAPKVKQKLVRDSFTMPSNDFALIDQLKTRAIDFKRPVKKSELLRAGLQALAGLNDVQLKSALDKLTPLKPGRPKKVQD